MRYRLGDTAPPFEWEVDKDLTGATVTATYTRPDGTTSSRVCDMDVVDVTRNGFTLKVTKLTHEWFDTDLTVLGVGALQLRWTDATETGTIHPADGWRVLVVP